MARGKKKAEQEVAAPAGVDWPSQANWVPERQTIPKGSMWDLYGEKSGCLLHEGASTKNAPHLLAGQTSIPLANIALAEECTTVLDGRKYILKRTA